jgi:hypothetical protein
MLVQCNSGMHEARRRHRRGGAKQNVDLDARPESETGGECKSVFSRF